MTPHQIDTLAEMIANSAPAGEGDMETVRGRGGTPSIFRPAGCRRRSRNIGDIS
jgi:hypothetical protein